MIDYTNIGAVCSDCARKAGFVPKKKTVGMWVGECDICQKEKPCTDLWHDWVPRKPNATFAKRQREPKSTRQRESKYATERKCGKDNEK